MLGCFLTENSFGELETLSEKKDSSGIVGSRQGCGRPQTAHTTADITKVKDLFLFIIRRKHEMGVMMVEMGRGQMYSMSYILINFPQQIKSKTTKVFYIHESNEHRSPYMKVLLSETVGDRRFSCRLG